MRGRWTIRSAGSGTSAFDACAAEYARARPRYPMEVGRELVRRLRLRRGARVLDIGAGTGISTRFLRRLGLRVTPLEPGAEMIRRGGGRAVRGGAERLPFRDGAFRAAVAVQSFHWMDARRTLRECARVARGLAILWVNRDDHSTWHGLHRLVRRYNPQYGRRSAPLDRNLRRRLGPGAVRSVHRFTSRFDEDRFLAYALSLSYLRSHVTRQGLGRLRREVRDTWPGGRRPLPFTATLWTKSPGRDHISK